MCTGVDPCCSSWRYSSCCRFLPQQRRSPWSEPSASRYPHTLICRPQPPPKRRRVNAAQQPALRGIRGWRSRRDGSGAISPSSSSVRCSTSDGSLWRRKSPWPRSTIPIRSTISGPPSVFSQSLFDGGATAAGARAAEAALSLAGTSRRGASADVAVAVAAALRSGSRRRGWRPLGGRRHRHRHRSAARARARRDAGAATDADVLSLEVHLARMRARHIDASSETRDRRRRAQRRHWRPTRRALGI